MLKEEASYDEVWIFSFRCTYAEFEVRMCVVKQRDVGEGAD